VKPKALFLTASQEVVTPLKNGVQAFVKPLVTLDSGFRRNDGKGRFLTSYEFLSLNFDTDKHLAYTAEVLSVWLGIPITNGR
jgi:hypothetical protein